MLLGLFRISGHSMMPIFNPNDRVLASSIPYLFFSPKVNEVIVFEDKRTKKVLIKKIISTAKDLIIVRGENKNDSVEVEPIERKDILGKVIIKI